MTPRECNPTLEPETKSPLLGTMARMIEAEVTPARRGPWFMFRGPQGFEWTRIRAPVPGLPTELHGFRFVHLSDLHMRSYWSKGYDELIAQMEQSPPDLLL